VAALIVGGDTVHPNCVAVVQVDVPIDRGGVDRKPNAFVRNGEADVAAGTGAAPPSVGRQFRDEQTHRLAIGRRRHVALGIGTAKDDGLILRFGKDGELSIQKDEQAGDVFAGRERGCAVYQSCHSSILRDRKLFTARWRLRS
jgi:hypothetical protein